MKRVNVIFASFVTVCSLIAMSMNNYKTLGVIQDVSNVSFTSDNQGVEITSKVVSKEDQFVKDLSSSGYTLVEIEIRNQTSKKFNLSQDSLSLPQASTKEITWGVTKKSIPRSIGLKIASFFFFPMMIPSTIDSVITYKNHRALKTDLKVKTLKKDGETLLPYTTTKRFIFVKESDWKEWTQSKSFEITLQESNAPKFLTVTTILENVPS